MKKVFGLTVFCALAAAGIALVMGILRSSIAHAQLKNTFICEDAGTTDGIVGGSGTSANPYQICSYAGLVGINNHMSSSYILLSDIDLAGVANFQLIGKVGNGYATFRGNLNGDFHKIKNLTQLASAPGGGIFYGLHRATIENLGIENVNIAAQGGGLAVVMTDPRISNVYVTGAMSGNSSAGLAAHIDFSDTFGLIQNCYVHVRFSGMHDCGLANRVSYEGALSEPSLIVDSYTVVPGASDAVATVSDRVGYQDIYYDASVAHSKQFAFGLSTASMRRQSAFSGFNFTHTWMMPSGGGYPVLRGF